MKKTIISIICSIIAVTCLSGLLAIKMMGQKDTTIQAKPNENSAEVIDIDTCITEIHSMMDNSLN